MDVEPKSYKKVPMLFRSETGSFKLNEEHVPRISILFESLCIGRGLINYTFAKCVRLFRNK